jgi:hypothetical protein
MGVFNALNKIKYKVWSEKFNHCLNILFINESVSKLSFIAFLQIYISTSEYKSH